MSKLDDLIEEGKRHEFTLLNREGKVLFRISLLWAMLITIAAPQVSVIVLIAMILEIIDVEYDGRLLGAKSQEQQ